MLKIIRFEILIIAILLLIILLNINFYDYSLFINNFSQQIYLKQFFESITTLGDSLWYFIISISIFLITYFLEKTKIINKHKKIIKKIKFINFLLFLSILTSGILAQIIKHILGRPRPGTLINEKNYELNFFSLDSNFHSFPSGHTSTIFAVTLVIVLLMPKLRHLLYFFAIIVSFSRVVVGAHFITDVVGGIAIAFIGFKISKLVLSKLIYKKNNTHEILRIDNNFILLIFSFLLLSIFFTIGPTLDIFISCFFYLGKNQFIVQSYYYIAIFFRKIILSIILVYILILPIFSFFVPVHRIYYNYFFKIREIIYIWSITFLNLVLIVNIILKNMWGRVRPNEIIEFDGGYFFTPWYQISNQCNSNCSFVSGDAAVGFSLVVFYFIIKKEIYLWAALFFGLSVGMVRISEGGHFFSDVVFSCLIVFLFNFLIHLYYSKKLNG